MAQNSFRKIFNSKVFLFALLLLLVWLGIKTVKMIYQKQELGNQISNLKTEIEKLNKSSQEFSQLMEYMKDPAFLEKEAKEKLNLKKEGENVALMPKAAVSEGLSGNQNTSTPPTSAPLTLKENNLVKWWKFFFGE